MINEPVSLVVVGDPAPKGSLKCVGRNGRHQLVEANPRTRAWRKRVAEAAAVLGQHADHWQPLVVRVEFWLERPASHFRTGRNQHLLREAAPPFPVSHVCGDTDKLLRLILDALQDAQLLHDDAQVVSVTASKYWVGTGQRPQVMIGVAPLEEAVSA